jgi:hypothetical protein
VVSEVPEYPRGHSHVVMRKHLPMGVGGTE